MPRIDREALLCALVLAPATYSRNRFFDWYKNPEIRDVRRRAAQIRGIVRHLVPEPRQPVRMTQVPDGAGAVELAYEVPALGLRRTARLDPLEVSLVRYALARAAGPLQSDDPDRVLIEAALARLAPPALGADVGA